jgi:hypothetical protein
VDFRCSIVAYDFQLKMLKTLWEESLGKFYERYKLLFLSSSSCGLNGILLRYREVSQMSKVDITSTFIGAAPSYV